MRSSTFRRLAASIAVSWCMLLLCAGAARAEALPNEVPQVVEDNIPGLAEYTLKEAVDPNGPCGEVCADLTADMMRPATVAKDPVRPSFIRSLFDNRFNVKSRFKLNPGSQFGRLSLAGALFEANVYVWKVKVYDV